MFRYLDTSEIWVSNCLKMSFSANVRSDETAESESDWMTPLTILLHFLYPAGHPRTSGVERPLSIGSAAQSDSRRCFNY